MFRDFTDSIRSYRNGDIDAGQLTEALGTNPAGRTPNPQRICVAIELANVIGPIVESMMQPPGTWTPIPLPAFCTTPTPAGAMTAEEAQKVIAAVAAGFAD